MFVWVFSEVCPYNEEPKGKRTAQIQQLMELYTSKLWAQDRQRGALNIKACSGIC